MRAGSVAARLEELGISLPEPPPVAGAYRPFVIAGGLLFVSGQLPMADGELRYRGLLGRDLTVDEGFAAARLCGLNLLAQARAACGGDLDRLAGVVRIGGFVACVPEFIHQPKVVDGASQLMVEVLQDAGGHSRFAVGAPSLPLGAAVEIEAIFALGEPAPYC